MNESDRPPGRPPPLFLRAFNLLSKWGFNDGDLVEDWYYRWTDDAFPSGVDDREILRILVERYLLPAVAAAGHTFRMVHVDGIHNNVRIDFLDGEEVDDREENHALDGIEVEVDGEEVVRLMRSLADREEEGRP